MTAPENKKRPAPFSLRLSFDERVTLSEAAGDMPLGSYIRAKLFDGETAHTRKKVIRLPEEAEQQLAQILGELGHQRLSSNLNQLAKHANTGSLPVTPETEAALNAACAEVREMRDALIGALGGGRRL